MTHNQGEIVNHKGYRISDRIVSVMIRCRIRGKILFKGNEMKT